MKYLKNILSMKRKKEIRTNLTRIIKFYAIFPFNLIFKKDLDANIHPEWKRPDLRNIGWYLDLKYYNVIFCLYKSTFPSIQFIYFLKL